MNKNPNFRSVLWMGHNIDIVFPALTKIITQTPIIPKF